MKKPWLKKTRSFAQAKKFDEEYYEKETPEERLSDVQFCREQYFLIKGLKNVDRKRFQKVFRIIKQA